MFKFQKIILIHLTILSVAAEQQMTEYHPQKSLSNNAQSVVKDLPPSGCDWNLVTLVPGHGLATLDVSRKLRELIGHIRTPEQQQKWSYYYDTNAIYLQATIIRYLSPSVWQ